LLQLLLLFQLVLKRGGQHVGKDLEQQWQQQLQEGDALRSGVHARMCAPAAVAHAQGALQAVCVCVRACARKYVCAYMWEYERPPALHAPG